MRPLSRQTSHGRMIHETLTQRAPPSRELFPLLPVDGIGDELDMKPFWRRPPRLVGETCTSTLGVTPIATGAYAAVGAVLAEQTCAETSFCRAS